MLPAHTRKQCRTFSKATMGYAHAKPSQLMSANSHGSFFAKNIEGRFRFTAYSRLRFLSLRVPNGLQARLPHAYARCLCTALYLPFCWH
jgi:hypothetical protein